MDTEPPEPGLFIVNFILAIFINWGLILQIITLLMLLLCSALISGSEVAYFSLNNNDIENLRKDESVISKRLLKLKDKPRSLLATILISNNFINIAIIIVSDLILTKILPDGYFDSISQWFQETLKISIWTIEGISRGINFIITVVGVTFLLVLFGEVLPKIYANINKMKFAKLMANPLTVLTTILGIFSRILVRWSNTIEERVEKHSTTVKAIIKDDIDKAIDLTVSKEENAEEEADILKGILKFSDVLVKQIMTPRTDTVAVENSVSFDELLTIIKDSGYSRIPVINEDFDDIEGILYVKDLLGLTNNDKSYNWQGHIRSDVFYVPESKKINELLKEFQLKRQHLAIVVDEYGGTSGIVTLEDIMEEIIGDIRDEFDEESEIEFLKIDDNNYIFEGKTLLNDVCRVIGVDQNTFDSIKGESDTLAGLFLEVTGKIPKVDSELEVDHYKLKIVSVTNRRIEKINLMIKR